MHSKIPGRKKEKESGEEPGEEQRGGRRKTQGESWHQPERVTQLRWPLLLHPCEFPDVTAGFSMIVGDLFQSSFSGAVRSKERLGCGRKELKLIRIK